MVQNALSQLGAPASPLNSLAAFQEGQALGQKQRLNSALAAYAANPADAAAQMTIMELDPQLGFEVREQDRERRFEGAAARYIGGGLQTPNALQPSTGSSAFDSAFAPYQMPQEPSAEGEIDYSPMGDPVDDRDRAFLEMVKLDPKRAFQIDSAMRDQALDRLEMQEGIYGFAVSRLGGVKDPEGYQAALADIQARVEPLGVQVTQFLPERFPGPQRLKEIRLSAIDAKDQVALFLQEANIQADNERADRNTASLIETRDRRAGEYERHNRASEANQRRGQNMRDATSRRGQDITDARVRSGRRRGRSGNKIPVISSPAEAARLPSGTRFRTPDGRTKVAP